MKESVAITVCILVFLAGITVYFGLVALFLVAPIAWKIPIAGLAIVPIYWILNNREFGYWSFCHRVMDKFL